MKPNLEQAHSYRGVLLREARRGDWKPTDFAIVGAAEHREVRWRLSDEMHRTLQQRLQGPA